MVVLRTQPVVRLGGAREIKPFVLEAPGHRMMFRIGRNRVSVSLAQSLRD